LALALYLVWRPALSSWFWAPTWARSVHFYWRGVSCEKKSLAGRRQPKFLSDQAIGKQGFKMVLLTRLSPVFPFVLLNYLLGLTAVRMPSYVLANLLGMLPATFLFVYIGAAARDALGGQADASAGFYQQILKYVGLFATVGVVVVVTRVARKALREAEQSQEGNIAAGKPLLDPNHRSVAYGEMLLAEDVHDRRLIENCHPSRWSNPTPAGKYNLVVIGGGTAGLERRGAAGWGQGGADRAQSVGRRLSQRRLRAVQGRDPRARRCDARNGAEFGIQSGRQSRRSACRGDGAHAPIARRDQRT
jgi:hypothetical protein